MPERGLSRKPQIAMLRSSWLDRRLGSAFNRGLRAFCATSSGNIDPRAVRALSFDCVCRNLQ
jgi:hypothetical protein